ncbi:MULTISPECIES: protein-disulfide reductase DsbD domain-containing protein [Gammaproteobacteria]|uniref:protein-disulfide reductase DsbD family protein n=1 Tax=Gammaproteobacteria TaxID=1236 RepID=UPI000DD08A59|nr:MULTISPECIES: protein-disulfide reductase DsbD domain-containing protein [Gammaproteobacteria]RTE86929.1 thiol:disulfide interchange protein [Aliidiomarina sp. B3213]TCZ93281.1 thiol:disulfide interchange protein [Lysobacter sp. N42]
MPKVQLKAILPWFKQCFSLAFLLLLAPSLLYAQTNAQASSERVVQPHVNVQLHSEFDTISAGHLYTLAIELEQEENWHTYWINPGDSGEATKIEWQGPEGSYFDGIQWPTVNRYEVGPLINYGFSDTTYLLTDFSIPSEYNEDTVTLTTQVSWLVCEDICIPGNAELSVTLNVGMPSISEGNRAHFMEARRSLPELSDWNVQYDIQDGQVSIVVEDADAVAMAQEQDFYTFVGATDLVEHNAEWQVESTDELLILRRPLNTFNSAQPEGFPVQFSSSNRTLEAYAAEVVAPEPATTNNSTTTSITFVSAFIFAFLGGVILNLMPCVFPVLSLKALAMAQHPESKVKDALFYCLGVILSFIFVAAVLIALRSTGQALGWGFQLQNPWFIAVLSFLFVAIGLNLSGVFQVATSLMSVGQSSTQGSGAKQSFATGVLAVIVASPCTAPFMGAALGFAITQPVALSLIIFFALGLGFAFPFLLIGLIPQIAKVLPKPGQWMESFKQWMAFPMYITTVWLIWVFGRQTGMDSTALLLLSMILLAASLWWWGQLQQKSSKGIWGKLTLLLLVVGTVFIFWQSMIWQQSKPATEQGEVEGRNWQVWSQQRMDSLIGEQPVFVNMTADWCITCLANERVALSVESTQNLFENYDVAYLKGDWTMQDPAITEYLAEFGRNGVPLYVLYWPGKEPQVLPQILSPSIVREHIENNAG